MKIVKHIILLVICVLPLAVMARQFNAGDKIYVNADQTVQNDKGKLDWTIDNAKLFLYLFDGSGDKFVDLVKTDGKTYMATMTAGTWNKCIVVRKPAGSVANWDGVWTQTSDLDIPSDAVLNAIRKMPIKNVGGDTYWTHFVPEVKNVGKYVTATEEAFSICANAFGGPYALHPKLTADKSKYDRDEGSNISWRAWFMSYDKVTWTSLDGYAGTIHDGGTLNNDIANNILPSLPLPSGKIYYFLYSANPSRRRLIKLTPDATGCELDCTITSFEVACSEVNANDTTYTLDGMVAFGEPKGDLIITCDGKYTTIKADDAKSPQTFSITGLRADTASGNTTTAVAKFMGDAGCSKSKTFTLPNATQGITITHIDVPLGETTPLNPSGANYANEHKWYIDGVEQPGMQGAQTSIAFDEPNTTRYTYREFNPPAGDMSDMMNNGGYEEADGNIYKTSPISEYAFWGKYDNASTPIDYYATHSGASNGFAVVQNANKFAGTYANVTAREKQYFALFDAASGSAMAGKKAWKAETAKNPNLKLQKGTTYLFSFWAANINNYGEMDNAAKLQFQIEYNGKTVKLGEPLDLNKADFRNNRWHQCSSTFYADADASSVTISVVNLNNNSLNIGNDFALDDIQFRAVSSVSRAVRIQEVFVVKSYNPCVDGRIFRKWDNVLFVNNGDSIYVAYQWYKNDVLLLGETQQRLYSGPTSMENTPDLYHCVATREDGTMDKLCAYTFNEFPESRKAAAVEDITLDGIAVWPTKIASGESVTVSKTSSGAVQATLLTLTGQAISTTILKETTNTIIMPAAAGLYLLRLQGASTQRTVKINVL